MKGNATGFAMPSNPGAFNTKVYYNSLKIKGKIKPDSIKIIKADYDKILSYTGKLSDMLENNYKKIHPVNRSPPCGSPFYGTVHVIHVNTVLYFQL